MTPHKVGCMCPECGRQDLKEDDHGVVPHQAPRFSFDAIESQLAELLDLRETAEAEGELPETLAVIDEQIKTYMAREVKKVDGICHAIRTYAMAAEYAQKEAARMYARAKALEARVARIKETAKAAMQAHSVRVIETPNNTMRVQGNGGLQPLEIADPLMVPESCRSVTVTVSVPIFRIICAEIQTGSALREMESQFDSVVDNEAVRQALKRGPVEGARLLERGTHLRIS